MIVPKTFAGYSEENSSGSWDPISVFQALGAAEGSVLFERPGASIPAVIGLDPIAVVVSHGGKVTWTGGPVGSAPEGAPLAEVLRAVTDLAAVCVLGGDALRDPPRPGPDLPDGAIVVPGTLIYFEPERIRLEAPVWAEPGRDPAAEHAEAIARLDELADRLATVPPVGPIDTVAPVPEPTFDSEIPDAAYHDLIVAAHRRIVAGEARQVTISRRFAAETTADPLAVYRVLRVSNPSPYHFLLRLPGVTLVGASPQGLVSVTGRDVSVPVIAGTRRRGADDAADAALAAELLADPKERDEHAMLVDLARADLAGVATPGSVRVADGSPEIRRYAKVMHLVSKVTGELAPDRTSLDALAAVFPAGTVAGTPREAALRIIEDVEPRPRGLYGGAVGLFGPGGDLDLCLGIRTLQFAGDQAYCQAGAGVVAGSVPDLEVRESRDKASALFAALEAAGNVAQDVPPVPQ